MKLRLLLSTALLAGVTAGCTTVYYGAMETVGIEKRDILGDRIADAGKVLAEASGQFKSALDVYMEVVDVDGGDLEKTYKRLSKELDRSEKRADDVHKRIAKVESVSNDLFKEWKKELKSYSDKSLKKASEQKLKETRSEYDVLIGSMKRSAAAMDPVLDRFSDQVLFLKHNLNSQAIAGLQDEAGQIHTDVTQLINEMESSISEAEAFVQKMEK